MGLLSGASKQYVENVEAEREQEMEMAQLRATKQAAADKRAVDFMSKASFYLTPGEAVGLGIADRNMAALVAKQDVPFFSYVRDYGKDGYENEFVQLVSMRGAGNNVMGVTLENAGEAYAEKNAQYRGALVQAARRIYDQESGKTGPQQKTLRRFNITQRIPGYENLSGANKKYIDDIISEAANLSIEEAKQQGLIDSDSFGAIQIGGDVVIEPGTFTSEGGMISVMDMPENQRKQINSIVMSGANTFADDPKDVVAGTQRTIRKVQRIEEGFNVPAQTTINAMTGMAGKMRDGTVQRSSSGILFVSPIAKKAIREDLDPVFSQLGFGGTVEVVQAAVPNTFVPRATGAPVGMRAGQKAAEDVDEYYARIGRERGDFDVKSQQLGKLVSTATTLKELLKLRQGDLGLAQNLDLFKSGVMSQAKQLFSSGSAEDNARIQQAQSIVDKIVGDDVDTKADAAIKFLSNELAYNVARSLDSETGNARLSQTDVQRAAASLSLEGLFISKANADAVLTVILRRAAYEQELASIMASGNIAKMQAAAVVRGTYGTEDMIRVTSLENTVEGIASGFNEFMQSVYTEAGINTTQPTPNAQPKTGFSESR